MPFGSLTAPVFWHHPEGLPVEKLPDVRSSDTKARSILRRLRTGSSNKTLVVVPSTPNSQLLQQQQQQPQQEQPARQPEQQQRRSASPSPTPSEAETAATDPPEEVPALPAYAARSATDQPPPYIRGGRQQQQQQQQQQQLQQQQQQYLESLPPSVLPPALPGYTPLPLPPSAGRTSTSSTSTGSSDPARDLKQPSLGQRRSYREILRRRLSSTKKLFDRGSDGGQSQQQGRGEMADSESARGVVLYRDDHDRWVGAGEMDEVDDIKFMQAKQSGLKGWLRRVWVSVKEFMEEHPMLFFVALFVIIVVALCILI